MSKQMNGTKPSAPPKNPDFVRVLHRNGELKLLDARDRPITGVIGCDIAMRPGLPPLMRMNIAAGAFEVEGVPVFQMYDPASLKFRPIKRVEFADDGPAFEAPVFQPQAAPPVAQPEPAATVATPEAKDAQAGG